MVKQLSRPVFKSCNTDFTGYECSFECLENHRSRENHQSRPRFSQLCVRFCSYQKVQVPLKQILVFELEISGTQQTSSLKFRKG